MGNMENSRCHHFLIIQAKLPIWLSITFHRSRMHFLLGKYTNFTYNTNMFHMPTVLPPTNRALNIIC